MKWLGGCVALLVVAVVLPVRAQDSPPRPGRGQAPQRDVSRLLERFDKNQDGFLDADEVPDQVKRRFKQMDKNSDGKLSKEELQGARPNAAPPTRKPGEVITPAAKGERYDDTLKVGDIAPNFTLSDPEGKRDVTLSDFREKKPVVLIFGSYT